MAAYRPAVRARSSSPGPRLFVHVENDRVVDRSPSSADGRVQKGSKGHVGTLYTTAPGMSSRVWAGEALSRSEQVLSNVLVVPPPDHVVDEVVADIDPHHEDENEDRRAPPRLIRRQADIEEDRQRDETDPSEHHAADNELRKALHDRPRMCRRRSSRRLEFRRYLVQLVAPSEEQVLQRVKRRDEDRKNQVVVKGEQPEVESGRIAHH